MIAGVTTLGGVTAALYALLDVVRAPECQPFYGDVDISGLCTDTAESLRAALNAAIVVIVAGAVWWWHLRGARRDPVAPAATSV